MTADIHGPSPRVRGNHAFPARPVIRVGTIPAGAGEPADRGRTARSAGDHPRGCGGTFCLPRTKKSSSGPSPRVRGNPGARSCPLTRAGTIPAGAGEPASAPSTHASYRDHPRGCGGTKSRRWSGGSTAGPSPRVRGNRTALNGVDRPLGTIPAGAGEPTRICRGRCGRWDHPRGCGGTGGKRKEKPKVGGPSPRVRGNHALSP